MALSTTTSSIAYVGNGVTTSFAYPFRILDASHLVVQIGGTTQVSGYSVTGVDASAGGFVNFTTAPASGASVVLQRVVPLTQPVDTVNNETILEDVIDKGFDRATMQIQQVDTKVGRAFRLADNDSYTGTFFLPDTSARKGGFLYFNSSTGAPEAAQPSGPLVVNNVAPSVQTFSGTGAQISFALSATAPSSLLTYVFISGVYQQKDRYAISGQTLTFVVAPPAGTNNIEVVTLPSYAVAGGVAASGIVDASAVGRAVLVALTQAAARSAIGLGTSDTVRFARTETGDGAFYSALASGNPLLAFDANDYIAYDRTANLLAAFIGGAARLQLDGSTFTIPNGLQVDASNVLRMNSGYGSLAPAYGVRAWASFSGVQVSGTYSRSGTLITVTLTAHGMSTGQVVNLSFTTGTATSGNYIITVTGTDTFTVTDTVSGTTSGNVTRNIWIRASGNVSSIARNGAGDYTINFTSAMPDTNYAVSGSGLPTSDNFAVVNQKFGGTYSTSAVQVRTGIPGIGFQDLTITTVSIVR